MSEWKVEAGTCNCPLPKKRDLPIDFTPTHEPGLCPACFSKGEINYRTINDRLSSLSEKEKKLLFRNFYSTHLERRHTTTTRYQMVKFGFAPKNTSAETAPFRAFSGRSLESRTGAETAPFFRASGRSLESRTRVETLFVYRFSWGNNPDPEEIRRLLFDDIPNARNALMRNYERWKDVQIRPVLVCEKPPSRRNSAWRNIIDAARSWPMNPTQVRVRVFSEMIAYRCIRMGEMRRNRQNLK